MVIKEMLHCCFAIDFPSVACSSAKSVVLSSGSSLSKASSSRFFL